MSKLNPGDWKTAGIAMAKACKEAAKKVAKLEKSLRVLSDILPKKPNASLLP